MKYPILDIIFFSTILFGCDCGIDKEELFFKKSELTHFSSFKVGDTLVYLNQSGEGDTIVVREISKHDEDPEVNCGIISAQPSNYKVIHVEHLPINIYPYSHWEVDSSAQTKEFQDLMSISITPSPRKVDLHISFKNYIFNGSNFEKFKISKDTTIGRFNIKSFYRFSHSYPERIKDSSYIKEVYWSSEEGLIAYKNERGNLYIKN